MPFYLIIPHNMVNFNYHFPLENSIYAINYDQFREKICKFINDPNCFFKYWEKLKFIIQSNTEEIS